MIRVRAQFDIDEYTAAPFARPLLQRQGDQIAEATFGHRVLVRKQAVIGSKLQLSGPRAGMADDGRAQASGIASRNAAGKEHPDVRPIA